ncbi:MAG: hypothetical protein E7633_06285 [Ruminococcaceae bacterium]|nr:hypothetical protein [Oscillospiraceae bacterium]
MNQKELFEALRSKANNNGFLCDVEVEVELTDLQKNLFEKKLIDLKDLTKDDMLVDEEEWDEEEERLANSPEFLAKVDAMVEAVKKGKHCSFQERWKEVDLEEENDVDKEIDCGEPVGNEMFDKKSVRMKFLKNNKNKKENNNDELRKNRYSKEDCDQKCD